jgi:hypothetical protein
MAEAHHAMTFRDFKASIDHADPLDHAYKTRACLAMSYPKQRGRLTLTYTLPVAEHLEQDQFEDHLKASGLLAIVENLYPHPTSQAQ